MRGLVWALALLPLVLGSCQRSCGDCWQDTKTAGKHMGRGMMALIGKHPEEAHPCKPEEFLAVEEEDFIPYADEDLYHGILRGDQLALARIDADTAIPQSRLEPGQVIPGIEGFVDPQSGELRAVFQNVHFETDDYAVRGTENWTVVHRIADYMHAHPELYIFVEGHCDERGAAAYNLALGTRRAGAVRNALVKEGINPDRIFTVSYGKEKPLTQDHTAVAWKQNRRGQFKVHQQADALCKR